MLIIGIRDKQLLPVEREWIRSPQVSGVILFMRNFDSREQVAALIADIRAARTQPLLICVDQEGGPVQRFRAEFTRLPALARIGEICERDPRRALELSGEHAWLMASEMRAIDIDLSFAPVLDLAIRNVIVGERAFHADPKIVSQLGLEYVRNMRLAGMAATIKHFPGHGSVREDTHVEKAVDARLLGEIRNADMIPFVDAIDAGAEAVMMGHVAYPAVDALPAGYSPVWIRDILRGELGFRGAVFSDDISMAAAESAGGIGARIAAHRDAGCDIVLVCKPEIVPEALAACRGAGACDPDVIAALRGRVAPTWQSLADNPQRARAAARLTALETVSA
ncbi:MAG: beta-N-acetylhexosaminidase [Xanthomonadaceae bacterium]|nr:beta-N-acetylhexosaminidase [Xanthomonadaceae bacterium]